MTRCIKRKLKNELKASMTGQQKRECEEKYTSLLIDEMIAATIESDEISVHKLAKEAGLSPTIVQGVKSRTRKNASAQSLFKILKDLGCKIIIEKKANSSQSTF